MLVVTARFDVKPGYRDLIIEMAKECLEKSPKEEGNISYTLLKSIDDETTLMYFEEWRDEEVFQKHLRQPYYTAFVAARQKYFASAPVVSKYEARKI